MSDSVLHEDSSPPGFLVHRTLQARILEWVTMPSPGDFPTQGSTLHLLGLLHWQAGSLPLTPVKPQMSIFTKLIYLSSECPCILCGIRHIWIRLIFITESYFRHTIWNNANPRIFEFCQESQNSKAKRMLYIVSALAWSQCAYILPG